MKSVLVLMSTYNGEKYLREQLDSILAQKDVDVTILVRDDGSKDSTVEILEEYKNAYPEIIILEKGKNIGCRGSFFWLIKEAAKNFKDFDYYAFSDQDDIWFENKLISGIGYLDKVDNKYKVYFCNHQMVNEKLEEIPTPHIKARGTLEESFIYQPCIGCSMIMSPALIIATSLSDPNNSDIHDSWTYRVNLVLGGDVVQDMAIYMLYRQHSTNTIGSNQSFVNTWKRRINSFLNHRRERSRQAKELLRVYANLIPKKQKETLLALSSYDKSFTVKWKILFSHRFRSNISLHNIMFKFAILTNRI